MKENERKDSPVRATRFPSLDMSKIIKIVEGVKDKQLARRELENHLAENDLQNRVWTSSQLQAATDLVIKEILETYFYKKDIKRKIFYNGAKKSSKTISYIAIAENAILNILLVEGSLIYSAKVRTVNRFDKEVKVCYYDERNMLRNDEGYLRCVLRDFSKLAHECRELKFCFEWSKDHPPRGVFMDNGAVFYEVHEREILTPMHYYAGYYQHENIEVDLNTGITSYSAVKHENPEILPFDRWLKELINMQTDG